MPHTEFPQSEEAICARKRKYLFYELIEYQHVALCQSPRKGGCEAQNVRFGSKADIEAPPSDVRFTPKSGHRVSGSGCPLCAKSRHSPGRLLCQKRTSIRAPWRVGLSESHVYY